MRLSELERITAVETRLSSVEERMERIENKLDELLELKNKSAGAFWLISLIVGSGVLGMVGTLFSWWRH